MKLSIFKKTALAVVLIVTCLSCKVDEDIHIIVYENNFIGEQAGLFFKEKLHISELIDSIKIYGTPIPANKIKTIIDTSRANQLQIPLDQLKKYTDSVLEKNIENHDLQMVLATSYTLKDGNRIPLSNIVDFSSYSGYHEPEIFIPDPQTFYYNQKKVIYIKLLPKKGKKNLVIEHIHEQLGPELRESLFTIEKITGPYINYQIIKSKPSTL
ncbi:hypothetical protein [Aquimarina pacifica]|uniref:hypothetical protein n=1 Tax=Aquimarina pacifica TaxID=1296415 RepID=UPI00047021B8|nr:hypothetical protein [Aquimarina pacifica]